MRHRIRFTAFLVPTLVSSFAFAEAPSPGAVAVPAAPTAPTAPPESRPGPAVPGSEPRAPAAAPAPQPPLDAAPYPPAPVRLPPTPSDLGNGTSGSSRVRVMHTAFALELGGSLDVSARFPKSEAGRDAAEIADAGVGLGAWVGSRTAMFGISVERVGLGKDLYVTNTNGETLNASYLVDTLWLAGRWYFTDDRPAFYLSLAAGPALPRVRATGTHASSDALVVPPESYQCSRAGRVGAGIAIAPGTEFDIAESWSVLAEARLSGHFMSAAGDAFSGCGPGTGPAVTGALRLGVSYRFGGG